jgi:HK97 gp10 family phage protein
MSVTAKVIGLDSLRAKLRALPNDSKKPVRDAINGGALAVEREAKTRVQRGKRSGRIYIRNYGRKFTGEWFLRRKGIVHQASAPGEPPKSDTGYLASHITTVLDMDGLGANVESQAEYSKHLEFGTSKMAARPFLFPSFERLKPKIKERIAQALNAAFKKRNS